MGGAAGPLGQVHGLIGLALQSLAGPPGLPQQMKQVGAERHGQLRRRGPGIRAGAAIARQILELDTRACRSRKVTPHVVASRAAAGARLSTSSNSAKPAWSRR